MSAAEIEPRLLQAINADQSIADTGPWAEQNGFDHLAVVGVMKSLIAAEFIESENIENKRYKLTEDSEKCIGKGSPEAQVFHAVPADGGLPVADLKQTLGALGDVGMRTAMQNRWLGVDKSSGQPVLVRKVETIEDTVLGQLEAVAAGQELPEDVAQHLLKKRKLLQLEKWLTYKLTKGPKFAVVRKKQATELTVDMLASGAWKSEDFKPYNFAALGLPPATGHLHPLLKVRSQFRKIFLRMGFEEMPTNNYVESSFWNFDALFQPQQHPARDAHDTFFLTKPATSAEGEVAYLERVKATHESGGFGSRGYNYSWKISESQKNLLRTHTTAVSSRMLYALAQEWAAQQRTAGKGAPLKPVRYFSIDRVFRNEAIDRTHLAEFHQVEGLVCARGLTLGDLIGTLKEFFERLGMKKIKFKPAYNPYTEPSMEIFSYSEELDKWMEVGNSGMFRPEMLRPMGLPEDARCIAWGLSLERPTMIMYGIDNIRDLFGHKVSLNLIRNNPICRLGF
ncbi:unnamed protein product [Pedinophyceae sp. YPF-701]|nr:unnamed protein product [Pedinophyceae sp. YPF-701]